MKKTASKTLGKIIAVSMCAVMSFCGIGCNNGGTAKKDNKAIVWTAYGTEKIVQGEYDYSGRYNSKTLQINAFRNEAEAAQIMFNPKYDVDSYNLEIADLRSADGNVLSKDSFDVYAEFYVNCKDPFKDTASHTPVGTFPDALIRLSNAVAYGKNKAVAGENQGIWVEVKPSKTQPAGKYTGTFVLTVDNVKYNVPVEVTVYDYTLGDTTYVSSAFFNPWNDMGTQEMDTSLELQQIYLEYMLNNRINLNMLPGNDVTIYNLNVALDRFIEYALIYAPDERVNRFSFPYWHDSIEAFARNDNGVLVEDRVTCATKDSVKPILRRCAEESLATNGTTYANIPGKMQTYYVYFDEYTQSDKLGEAQYTNTITQLWYQEIGYSLLIERAKAKKADGTYFDTDANGNPIKNGAQSAFETYLTADEQTKLNNLYSRMISDENAIKNSNKNYKWEKYAFSQFLNSLAFPARSIVSGMEDDAVNGLTGREYRKNLYLTLGFSRGLTDNAKITEQNPYGYYTMSTADATELFNILNKLADCQAFNDFEREVIYDTVNFQNLTVGNWTEACDFKTVFCTLEPDFATKSAQNEYKEIAEFWFGEKGKVWTYTAINPRDPEPSYHINGALMTARMYRWMMYDYNLGGDLYWDIMLDRNYQAGVQIQDYYTNPVRYGGAGGSNGEGYLLYPGKPYDIRDKDGNREPVPSMRLKAIRDGNEDYDLWYELDQMVKVRAELLGQDYDSGAVDSIIELLCQNAYTGSSINVGESLEDISYLEEFAQMRNTLAQLLVLADKGVSIDKFTINADSVDISVSAPENVTLKINNVTPASVIKATSQGNYKVYTTNIKLDKEANYCKIEAGSLTANLYLGGRSTIIYASATPVAGDSTFNASKLTVKAGSNVGSATNGVAVIDGADVQVVQINYPTTSNYIKNTPYAFIDLSSFGITNAKQITVELYLDGDKDVEFSIAVTNSGSTLYTEIVREETVIHGQWTSLVGTLNGAVDTLRIAARTKDGATVLVKRIIVVG